MNHMIVTRSFHTLGLSFLIYKMEIKKYFPTSESYCEAPNAHRHIVTLQMASLEMHNQQQLNNSKDNNVVLVPHVLGRVSPL